MSGSMKNLIKPSLVAMTSLALFIAQGSVKVEASEVTLRDAVAIGILTNPEYGVVANNRRATDEEYNQAVALYYPSIDAKAEGGGFWRDTRTTRTDSDADDKESGQGYDAGVTLTQLLFDGWATSSEVDRQKHRIESAAHRVHETGEFVGLDIVDAYLDVLRQRELLLISRQNVADHLAIMNQLSDSINAGRSTQADFVQAEARLANARATEVNILQDLRIAEARYRREVGETPIDLVVPDVPSSALQDNPVDAATVALEDAPTVEIYEADVDVAEAEYQASKATLYPEVDLVLNARTGEDLVNAGRDTSASARVVMNWNLYRGGGDVARSREFTYRHAEAKERRADVARGLENDVHETWASMMASRERAVQFAKQAEANERVVVAYKDQFGLDRRTLLDVLDAQNELFVSRSSALNAQYVEMLAVYRILALQGHLLSTLGVDRPMEAKKIDEPANYSYGYGKNHYTGGMVEADVEEDITEVLDVEEPMVEEIQVNDVVDDASPVEYILEE